MHPTFNSFVLTFWSNPCQKGLRYQLVDWSYLGEVLYVVKPRDIKRTDVTQRRDRANSEDGHGNPYKYLGYEEAFWYHVILIGSDLVNVLNRWNMKISLNLKYIPINIWLIESNFDIMLINIREDMRLHSFRSNF